jgi:alpha-mannosidase
MHDDQDRTEARVKRALDARLRPGVSARREACDVSMFASVDRVEVPDALASSYLPIDRGTPWGAPWSTTWFRVAAKIPAEWAGLRVEVVVDLGFDDHNPGFQAEGLAFAPDGTVIKAVSPRNNWLPIGSGPGPSDSWTCFVEAVAMPGILGERGGDDRFRPTELGDLATSGPKPLYVLGGADLVVVDEEALGLALDVEVLLGVAGHLARTDPRRHEILRALERCVDLYDSAAGPGAARQALAEVMSAPAARSAHRISAVGHAHIDSAWLWPVRETIRKCARTFANIASLGAEYPELVFACSQAQQWWWMKEQYPAIFDGMKEQVKKGQIVPVGGMWVESDTNVTGGESLVRQLVYGKRFFASELGVDTQEVWLPDCFGYSAALPQLILLSGSRWFLTQKLSWNETNKFPHHTFWWEGIDGSRVFTHFPPVDTYNAEILPSELAHAVSNYAEKGFGTRSLAPFGYGDGGGGPTREMMERARRLADLDGSPRVVVEAPSKFFAAAQSEYPNAPVWSGELYLETHRGVLTSEVEVKQGNRRCENLMREAELWSTAALVAGAADYPYDELETIWRDILLNQFHDILPGSSIAMVNDEAIAGYADMARRLENIVGNAISALCGQGNVPVAFNSAPHEHRGVPALAAHTPAPAAGAVTVAGDPPGDITLENDLIRVVLDTNGHVVRLWDLVAGREVIPAGAAGNVLQLHPDIPNKYPAWDVDAFYRNVSRDVTPPESITILSRGPLEAVVQVEYTFGSSRAVQTLRLAAGSKALVVDTELDWREHDRFLKVAFPVDVHAEQSSSEIQFGHIHRPTHTNTSWDNARFEFVAHRFVHVGEPGYGVAIVNGGIYGHEVRAIPRRGGGRATLVRLSMIRSPNFPDPRGDNGVHHFRYAIVAGATIADAVRQGYHFNLPLRTAMAEHEVGPLVALDNEAIVVEALKAADDRSGDVIVRCYESLGGRATAALKTSFPVRSAWLTDLLERPLDELDVDAGNAVPIELKPFQIVTLRLSPGKDGTGTA